MIEESKIKKFLVIGTSPSVIKRGIKYSIIVGTVLTLINHGGSLLERELDKIKLLRIHKRIIKTKNLHLFKMIG